ncbi:MAG: rhomboid family intramembrane serine protease [Prolixibacteraceae bacterium]
MPLLSRYYPGNYSEEQYQTEKRIGWHSLFISVFLIIVLWLIKLVEFEYELDLSGWGLIPRDLGGLRGILFSPLIHSNFDHLSANTVPLFVLTFSLFFFYRKSSYSIFLLIYLFSGIFVWLGGREAIHIGASGMIYGLAGFLFLSGVLSRNASLLTISLMVALLYGGLFWGVFPIKPEISWESHLWGAISGFSLAWLYRHSIPQVPLPEEVEEDDQDNLEWQEYSPEEEETMEQGEDVKMRD